MSTAKHPKSDRTPAVNVRFLNSKYFIKYYNDLFFDTDGSSKFFINSWAGFSICLNFYAQYYSLICFCKYNIDGGRSSSLFEV